MLGTRRGVGGFGVNGENEHPRGRPSRANGTHAFQPADSRQRQVERHHVDVVDAELQRRLDGVGFRRHVQPRVGGNDAPEPLANQRMVVDDEHRHASRDVGGELVHVVVQCRTFEICSVVCHDDFVVEIRNDELVANLAQLGAEWWQVNFVSGEVVCSSNARSLLGVTSAAELDVATLRAVRPFPPGAWRNFEAMHRTDGGLVQSRMAATTDEQGRLVGVFGLEIPIGAAASDEMDAPPVADPQLLNDILAVQTALVSRYTLEGVVVWCNHEYAVHLRTTIQGMIGTSWLERSAALGFDTRENLDGLLARLVDATADGAISTVVAPMWLGDSSRWIQWTNRRVTDPATGEELLQAIGVEVTELRSTRDALDRLSQELVAGRVSERRALARRIHDDVIQVLVSAGWLMVPADDDSVDEEAATRSVELLNIAVQQLRGLLADLSAPAVLLGSLADAVGAEAELLRAAGMHVQVELEEVSAEELRTVCARVLVEGMRNVARHASATHVQVSLRHVQEQVVGIIADNGVGASSDDLTIARAAGHVGLVMARAMVESIGGSLSLDSSGRSEGTTLCFCLPTQANSTFRRSAV